MLGDLERVEFVESEHQQAVAGMKRAAPKARRDPRVQDVEPPAEGERSRAAMASVVSDTMRAVARP